MPEESVEAAIQRIAEQQRKSEPVERPAETGDILTVDIDGRIGGEEIPGAGGKDRQIVLGGGGFVPGFEEQLIGAAAGEHREVRTTFPEDYAAAHLAGKEAVFEVDVKEVRQRAPAVVDDELAMAVGLENLAELREEVREQMERDYAVASRQRLKRTLLDKLAERYDFPVPVGMVDLEFENIWHSARPRESSKPSRLPQAGAQPQKLRNHRAKRRRPPAMTEADTEAAADTIAASPADGAQPAEGATAEGPAAPANPDAEETATAEGVTAEGAAPAADQDAEESAKAEYRSIAERRVRLGLLLAEVGRSNNITVTQDELNQAMIREVRRHPG